MSLTTEGFHEAVKNGEVTITITAHHPLIKLAQSLPWDNLLLIVLPDLQATQKRQWWVGRPLQVRIHLGIYLLQQWFDLTDRQAEYALQDNAAFRLFCGHGIIKKWHVPDHTKIEAFRSRLLPETQRKLANAIAVHASRLNYANPAKLDVDSTIQEANISYPSTATLLVKVALLAKRLVKPLNAIKAKGQADYHVNLKQIKAQLLYYFNLRRQSKMALSLSVFRSLWQAVVGEVLPILNASYQLASLVSLPKHWNLQRALEQLQWQGYRLIEQLYEELFENKSYRCMLYALHAQAVKCFDKNKLNKKKQYGRAFQLGRIEGNFAIVSECTSIQMPDAHSLAPMIAEHARLFGKNSLDSIATDKGYYALENQLLLDSKGLAEIGLPRPRRTLNAPPTRICSKVAEKLHNRRAGVEAMISHIKQGGQMDRSRMKSDPTTLAAGYAAVLGFNLRQLKRYLLGKVYPKSDNQLISALKASLLLPTDVKCCPMP